LGLDLEGLVGGGEEVVGGFEVVAGLLQGLGVGEVVGVEEETTAELPRDGEEFVLGAGVLDALPDSVEGRVAGQEEVLEVPASVGGDGIGGGDGLLDFGVTAIPVEVAAVEVDDDGELLEVGLGLRVHG
jgi:hypothetical protein